MRDLKHIHGHMITKSMMTLNLELEYDATTLEALSIDLCFVNRDGIDQPVISLDPPVISQANVQI